MSLLGHKPLSPEQQQKNDTPVNWGIVCAALGTLLVYAYLFTHIADWANLPRPQDLVEQFGIETENIFVKHMLINKKPGKTKTQNQ